MTRFTQVLALGLLAVSLNAVHLRADDKKGSKSETSVYIVEPDDKGKFAFPKVKVGDVVRFHESVQFAGGDIKVTVEGGAKVVRAERYVRVIGGGRALTGTNDMEFEVKAEKAGKAKIKVAVKSGDKTEITEHTLEVE